MTTPRTLIDNVTEVSFCVERQKGRERDWRANEGQDREEKKVKWEKEENQHI